MINFSIVTGPVNCLAEVSHDEAKMLLGVVTIDRLEMANEDSYRDGRLHFKWFEIKTCDILGDPGADSGDEEKSKRAEKYMARRKVKNGEKSLELVW